MPSSIQQTHSPAAAGVARCQSAPPTLGVRRDAVPQLEPAATLQRACMAPPQHLDAADGAAAIQRAPGKRSLSPGAASSPALKRARHALSSIEKLPVELVEQVLDHIPNGGFNCVTSLALSGPTMHSLALHKTCAKAKASDLLDLARSIDRIPVASSGPNPGEALRFVEFSAVLTQARAPDNALRGRDLTDVMLALADATGDLGSRIDAGLGLMIDALDAMGRDYNRVVGFDPADRDRQQLELDQCRADLVQRLSGNWLMLDHVADENKGIHFERLCSVLESIETPAVRNRVAMSLPLADWFDWQADSIGGLRFNRLIRMLETGSRDLLDGAKAQAIAHLVPKLAEHADPASCADGFRRLCNLAASIRQEAFRADAAEKLVGELGVLLIDSDFIDAERHLRGIANGLCDTTLRKRVTAALEAAR